MELDKTIQVRFCKGNFSSESESSPTSVLPTINRRHRKSHGRNGIKSRTLTELEELKGFKDLGFEFSEEDRKDHYLLSIVPGLRRLPGINEDVVIQRPYLSQEWEILEKNEAILEMRLETNLRLGEMGSDQNLMKEQIKFWARSVASAIR